MLDQLRSTCKKLLEDGKVQVVIGYGAVPGGASVTPVFITSAARVDQLTWNADCYHNLTAYLTRAEVKALGRAAVVVKACDERALVMLQKESQIDRDKVFVVGVACDTDLRPQATKCDACRDRVPRFADVVIGNTDRTSEAKTERYAELEQFLEKTPLQRMEYWQQELARCTKCYACRQVCPLCYCQRCIVDKNRPVCIDTSPTLKGNFAWHITRAFHLAGRCIGCDECTRACAAGIDLRLLNLSLARAAETNFGFRPGEDPDVEPLVGTYSEHDQESFIK
jgi:ferredoxin